MHSIARQKAKRLERRIMNDRPALSATEAGPSDCMLFIPTPLFAVTTVSGHFYIKPRHSAFNPNTYQLSTAG